MKSRFKKILKLLAYVCFLIVVLVAALETAYRFQWIDFYQAELNSLNDLEQLENKKNKVLVIGDSFSAAPDSYVNYLNSLDTNSVYINASIPGTGIIQHNLVLKNRIETFQPTSIIYQIYPSNDLLDIEKPTNFDSLSFVRNIYWMISDKIRVLGYVNSRLAILKSNPTGEELKADIFDIDKYNQREKLYIKSDSTYLEKSLNASGDYKERFEKWKKEFKLFKKIAGGIPIKLLVIPHAVQIDSIQKRNLESCGAFFTADVIENEFLKKVANEFPDVEILDPKERMILRNTQKSDLYFQNDPHLTKNGQVFLGEWLFKILSK
jgi:hypothetical protein